MDSSDGKREKETESNVEEKNKEKESVAIHGSEWYEALISKRFNEKCEIHRDNRINVFCFYCFTVECSQCSTAHTSHPQIKVLMSLVGDYTLRKNDISKFIDCSKIQLHLAANQDIVIKMKPSHKGKSIQECRKRIHKPAIFCSLSCKVEHVLSQEGDLSSISKPEEFEKENTSESSDDDETMLKTCKVEHGQDQERDLSSINKIEEIEKVKHEQDQEGDLSSIHKIEEIEKVKHEQDQEEDLSSIHKLEEIEKGNTSADDPIVAQTCTVELVRDLGERPNVSEDDPIVAQTCTVELVRDLGERPNVSEDDPIVANSWKLDDVGEMTDSDEAIDPNATASDTEEEEYRFMLMTRARR